MKNALSFFILFIGLCHSLSAQWIPEHTGGPEGGTGLIVYSNDQYCFFPGKHYLYRTADAVNWEELPIIGLFPFATSPGLTAAIQYYGMDEPDRKERLLVSEDNGTTWEEAAMPPATASLFEIAILSDGIYFPELNQPFMFKSADKGMTWEKIPTPSGVINFKPHVIEDTLFILNWGPIWQFDATSNTWTEITPDLGSGVSISKLTKSGPNWMAASQDTIYVSNDNRQTWAHRTAYIGTMYSPLLQAGDYIYYDNGGDRLHYTNDFGLTWKNIKTDDHILGYYKAGLGNQLILPVYDKGVYRFDPVTEDIVLINTGLNAAAVYDLDAGPNEIWAATGSGLFSYDIFTEKWKISSAPLPKRRYRSVAHNGQQYVAIHQAYFSDGVLYSTDNGMTWLNANIDTFGFFLFPEISSMNWVNNYLYIGDKIGFSCRFNVLTGVVEYDPQVRYPISFQGEYFGLGQMEDILKSEDQGETWEPIISNIPNLVRLFAAGEHLFALQRTGNQYFLIKSEDGITWSDAFTGLPSIGSNWDESVHKGDIWFLNDRYYFFFPNIGLYQSFDEGHSWNLIYDPDAQDLEFLNNAIFYGLLGGGVLRVPLVGLGKEMADGFIYNDLNNNGVWDSLEPPLSLWRVEHTREGGSEVEAFTYSQLEGRFRIPVDKELTDTLRVTKQSNYIEQINPPFQITTGQIDTAGFGIYFTPDILDVAIHANYLNVPRPGFDLGLQITGSNLGTVPVSGSVSVKLDPFFQFQFAKPTPDEIIGIDSLVWHYANWNPFTVKQFNVHGKMSVQATLGATCNTLANILPTVGDTVPFNNNFHLRQEIVGSYDPNDKQVSPLEGLTAEAIAQGEELVYTIRFQNTGTYEAERVRITDQLDTALIGHTFRLVDASHEISRVTLLPNRVLEIVFDGIALPDSNANEPASHGFVVFAIQRKKDYNPDFKIHNTAAIYFDFNDPIITNTVTTELYTPVVSILLPEWGNEEKTLLAIYPNPAWEVCRISTAGYMQGPGTLTMHDIQGRTILRTDWEKTETDYLLALDLIQNGVYILELKTAHKSVFGKLVVQR